MQQIPDGLAAIKEERNAVELAERALDELAQGNAAAGAQALAQQAEGLLWDRATVLTLSISILVFGLVTLFLVAYLMTRERTPPQMLQAFALPLIIIASIFLVVTGYSQDQIAPVIGLLGTIAGYLLGKGDPIVASIGGKGGAAESRSETSLPVQGAPAKPTEPETTEQSQA